MSVAMAGDRDPFALVAIFDALGHPLRWQITGLCARSDELSAAELKRILEVRLPVISYHAGLLVEAGVLRQRTERRSSFYRLSGQALPESVRCLLALARSESVQTRSAANSGGGQPTTW
jgi:DNA-binding transcriptional ArsR family regulator